MVAKFVNLNKPWSVKYGEIKTNQKANAKKKKKTTLLCTITLRNKTVARTFQASVANENRRLASLIAAGRRFARRNVYDSVTETTFWWRKSMFA